ncbi:peptidyl-prolyl cis-trans isomerase B (cyclophilin B) [Hymenobacter luteus]|uniref:Peptidyl-prolyl cis-trans isomerase n=2 Tax=Hymenobacter TaxID=89966 RepID=A0A7W9T1G4_9BACT|nr:MULTISPECIES: peptidylprolyl isomerase [Hymenobacter]MBB4600739.1 peptidyl-prolyl cis-trans isomerase B (cyclophilin B) [Hymenobacter latericoloratus]MBB6059054.1 peptidyl-prolyl cis-trans isomerase B (cyclophilin B) [Hymenobacter luteus]
MLQSFLRSRRSAGLLALVLLAAACNRTQPEAAAPPTPAPVSVPGPDLMSLADSNAAALLLPYGRQYPGREVLLQTRHGNMRIRLYEDTPLHTANFLLLARKGYFDQTVFNRVVKGFAIQGGTSDRLTMRLSRYRLPPEIRAGHFHKRGAVGMARYDDEQNPGKLSSSHDFYIVQGQKLTAYQAQSSTNRKLTPAQFRTYATQGGIPSLDGEYTVFGEVVEGLDVIDKIAAEPVGTDNWPHQDVHIKMKVIQ